MPSFVIGDRDFLLDGTPFRIISGALHYFRVHPEQWADRLHKAKLMGLNTVETYVPWNLHEPAPGKFRASDDLDLVRFLELADERGLRVLLRPGPYICSEWDFGGLPAWLLRDPRARPRGSDPGYLAAVDRYLDGLIPLVLPHLVTRGGPVLAVQVENEYGAYGADRDYLEHLVDALRTRGVDVPLVTCDQPTDEMLSRGGLPGLLRTGTFGSRVANNLATLRRHQPSGPLMCMEFWNGWFDHWGGPHHARDVEDAATALDDLLAAGASVNIYMFHGGTNFGFTNGANDRYTYRPTVTSYDYDAPLSESGEPTPKYHAFREVIARYAPVPDEPVPPAGATISYGPIALDDSVSMMDCLDVLSTPVESDGPLTMEELGQAFGFVLYRTRLPGGGPAVLDVDSVRDRAQVFVDGQPAGVLEREHGERALAVDVPAGGALLDILVENQGRVNYGDKLLDRKGVLGSVHCGDALLRSWSCYPLTLDDVRGLPLARPDAPSVGPAFHRGWVDIDDPADTFLSLPDWTKGAAWINGVNLGRFWRRGPQRTLYVPAPILRAGRNEILVLELEAVTAPVVHLVPRPSLGVVDS